MLPSEFRHRKGQVQRIRGRAASYGAVMDIETVAQTLVLGERAMQALVGQRQHEGPRRIVQREGQGSRNRARHVGHTIMHDAMHGECRVRMGLGGLGIAALIDRHVDDDGARLHRGDGRSGNELGRCGARNERSTNHQSIVWGQ